MLLVYIANIVVNSLVIVDVLKAEPCEMRDVTDQIYKVKKLTSLRQQVMAQTVSWSSILCEKRTEDTRVWSSSCLCLEGKAYDYFVLITQKGKWIEKLGNMQ